MAKGSVLHGGAVSLLTMLMMGMVGGSDPDPRYRRFSSGDEDEDEEEQDGTSGEAPGSTAGWTVTYGGLGSASTKTDGTIPKINLSSLTGHERTTKHSAGALWAEINGFPDLIPW